MSRFGVFWLPWLTTAANSSCRLKSAAAWGKKRKAEQLLRLTSDVLKDRISGASA